ncbi:MAG: hypothetical protein ABI689_09540 [Thermoanaerobaculia bacterium]
MKRPPATVVVFLLALGLYAATTHRRVFIAGNDASRWAAIESLVDFGSASVEPSRFAANIDRIRIAGRDYSNKPPLLTLAGAAIYAALQALFGWTLAGAGAASVLYWVTLLLVGVPSAWLVARFFAAIGRFPALGQGWRGLLTVALGAGTLLFTYSTTINNHTVAAALLFAACIAALDGRGFGSGLAVGLAAAVDLLPGLGLAPVFAWMLVRSGSAPALRRFAAGLGVCLAISAAANFAIHGSLLPAKLVAGAVDLSAQAGPAAGGVVLPQSPAYPLEILVGGHGLFAVSPVLLWGAWGLALACRRSSPALPFGPPGDVTIWRLLACGLALQFAGHAALAGSYGGWSYGYRYLLPIQPLLLLCAPLALTEARSRSRALFKAVLPVSILFAALGAYHPWPPAFEQESSGHPVARLVHNPIGGNAAAWLATHAPESALAGWAAHRFVSPEAEMQRRYFALFFGSKGDLVTMRKFAD